MVVDACFIASQIDVWTQAYNGPTSRRKYVLNLLNVLHKNVTEEYKTDQFLHVIYWFLIYKSNLGHFFRNEGLFSLLLLFLLLFSHQLLCAQTWPVGQGPAGVGPSRVCPRMCPRVAHALAQPPTCALVGVLGSCRPWAGGMALSSIQLCDVPHLRLKIGIEGW